ncbi:hypothetical protein E2C01_087352 [Portunus trituberculatus]|uniref:Uncharacterized protein n=1 Tax=Portunus trituberculatus TaxID=210409 RepID=A0A5B7JD40_PORTR|nr:hypothetical protein [Portunus trituberculatus]
MEGSVLRCGRGFDIDIHFRTPGSLIDCSALHVLLLIPRLPHPGGMFDLSSVAHPVIPKQATSLLPTHPPTYLSLLVHPFSQPLNHIHLQAHTTYRLTSPSIHSSPIYLPLAHPFSQTSQSLNHIH